MHTVLSAELDEPEVPEVQYEQDTDVAAEDVGTEGQEAAPEDTANPDPSSLSSVDQGKPRCII